MLTQVLVRWACDKISAAAATQPDEQLMDALQVGGSWNVLACYVMSCLAGLLFACSPASS